MKVSLGKRGSMEVNVMGEVLEGGSYGLCCLGRVFDGV